MSKTASGDVILCVCFVGGKLGAAYYDHDVEIVYMLHDVDEDTTDSQLFRSLLQQVRPNLLLISNLLNSQMMHYLKNNYDTTEQSKCTTTDDDDPARIDDDDDVNASPPPTNRNENADGDDDDATAVADAPVDEVSTPRMLLHILPDPMFDYKEATMRLIELLRDASKSDQENEMALSYRVNLQSVKMVRAVGALLRYMDAVRYGVEFEDYSVKTPVRSLEIFTLERMVEMDRDTYEALQIFRCGNGSSWLTRGIDYQRNHRHMLSIFNICNRCLSYPGKKLIRRWFERPLLDRQILEKRQKAISFFVQDCNLDVASAICKSLKRFRNITGVIRRLKKIQMLTNDFEHLYKSCLEMVKIGEIIKTSNIRLDLIDELLSTFNDDLSRTADLIKTMVDFNETKVENRVVICNGVDEKLDQMKSFFNDLPHLLSGIAREELKLSPHLQLSYFSVVYIPMVGYLIEIPSAELERGEMSNSIVGLEFMFTGNGINYYKNARMQQLDVEYGDVKFQIIDSETVIMFRLQSVIAQYTIAITNAARAVGVIDCAIALAMTARDFGWYRPHLVDDPIIRIHNGRHPLTEMISPTPFTANNIDSGDGDDDEHFSKAKILTGPNASGKSIYLKQVGVIAYLAHIGSFVPAERATIGPIDRIFTRVHTVDSVLDGMSTFARDIAQVSLALNRATGNSLVIIDEFGKGTITEVGLSLLASCINYWIRRSKSDCPHLIISSHFHAIIDIVDRDSDVVSFHTMEVRRNGSELEFLYKLVDGTIFYSFAAHTARKVGVDERVVNRGVEVYQLLKQGEPIRQQYDEDDEQESHDGASVHEQKVTRFRRLASLLSAWDVKSSPYELLENCKR